MQNKERCYDKLRELVLKIYQETVPGETSVQQVEKVKALKKRENEARLKLKKHLSSKKASRGHRSDD